MLEMIMDKKLLFVLMGIFAGIGVADKCVVGMTMKRLVQAAGNMNKSTHPLMRLVRAKFEHACMISDTVENVGVFVDKYLYEYKICGLPLHTVRRLEKICAGLCALTGLAGAFFSYQLYGMGDAVLRTGACGMGLGILVWLFHLTTDEEYCLQMAKNYMVDYLENVCLHKYEKNNGKERTGRQRMGANVSENRMRNQESDSEMEEAYEDIENIENIENTEKQPVSEKPVTGNVTAIEAMTPASTEKRGSRSRRGKRKNEPTRETARNLERATAKLAEATKSGRQYEEEYEAAESRRRDAEYNAEEVAEREKKYAEYEKTTDTGKTGKNHAGYTVAEAFGDSGENTGQSTVNSDNQSPEIPPSIEKELPKEEMIRQILQEFMA
ncbi:MAG: hypothetical protein V8R43_09105 [Dorea sp.]